MSVTRHVFSLAVLTLAFVACHPEGAIGIGLGRDTEGALTVAYRTCHRDATVVRVALLDANGTRAEISDDHVLWQISQTRASETKRFMVGQTPPGFREDVAFTGISDEGRLLWFVVYTSELPAGESIGFSANQLETDRLLVGDAYQTEDEFARGDACD